MPIPKHLEPLVQSLEKATVEGRLAWQDGAGESQFLASLSTASVMLFWGDQLSLSVLNAEGKIVDRFMVAECEKDFPRIQALYEGARRRARNADQVLKNLLDELEPPVPF